MAWGDKDREQKMWERKSEGGSGLGREGGEETDRGRVVGKADESICQGKGL